MIKIIKTAHKNGRLNKRLVIIAAVLVIGIASVAGGTPPKRPLSFLSVKGNKIVNAGGDKVILRGFEYSCFNIIRKREYDAIKRKGVDPNKVNKELAEYFFSEDDINLISDTGANVIRVNMRLWQMEDKPYSYSQVSLRHLDEVVEKWGKNGIYVILVLGEAGQNVLVHNKAYGNILWGNKKFQARVVSLWGVLAKRYKDNPYIAGYDIINEPTAPNKKALHSFYEKVIRKIREDDKKHILFIERNALPRRFKNVSFGGKYEDDNIALSVHFYKPHRFTHQGIGRRQTGQKYPGRYDKVYWDKNQIGKYFDEILTSAEVRGKPLYIGEFSASFWYGKQQALNWAADVVDVLNRRGLHYTFFQYKTAIPKTFGLYSPTPETGKRLIKLKRKMKKRLALSVQDKELLHTKNFEVIQELKNILQAGFSNPNNSGLINSNAVSNLKP